MFSATQWFEEVRGQWSDIEGHLDYFVKCVADLDATRVIELGVRSGVSTAAWLYALEGRGHLWSVDINLPGRPVGGFPNWTFLLGSDLDPDVLTRLPSEPVDLVFIDTSHEYGHTLDELTEYVPRVRSGGRVLCHDTELEHPEDVVPEPAFPVKSALERFCAERSLAWENFEHSYGLGVITIP